MAQRFAEAGDAVCLSARNGAALDQTVEKLKAAGGTCLAVEAGRTILLDKPAFLEAADKAGIAVVGVAVS